RGRVLRVGGDDAHAAGVDVAGEHDRVVDLPQPVDEPAAGRRVAVPLVEVVRRPRGGERVGGEDGLLADDVPARPAAGQLVLQPRLLLGAEHRAVRVAPLGAGRADVAGGVAGLVAAVLAAV